MSDSSRASSTSSMNADPSSRASLSSQANHSSQFGNATLPSHTPFDPASCSATESTASAPKLANAPPAPPQPPHVSKFDPVLKQAKPTSLNQARYNSMRQHRSKLHLIDDTTLTSLPLPPPPAKKWLHRRQSEKSIEDANAFAADGAHASVPANEAKFKSFSELSVLPAYNDVDCDDSFADSQDPIVLVEDYLTGAAESHSEEALLRKQSVANFKKRACDEMSRCSSGSTIDSGHPFAPSLETSASSGAKEDLEAMFGTIPGSDKLKYCTLCDKPLYEISSLMSSTLDQAHLHKLYTELVCSGCINTYQRVLDEMYQAEMRRVPSRPLICKGFNSLRDVYQREPATFMQTSKANTQKRVKRQFSRNLIGRLQNLSELSSPQRNQSGWLKLLQEKFNWNH